MLKPDFEPATASASQPGRGMGPSFGAYGGLSVCTITDAPAERVAALLEMLRPLADELVVAIDSRVDPGTLGRVDLLADRLMLVEYGGPPPERMFAWLHRQCTADWILRIDGDEVPSNLLLEELPKLTAVNDVTHYWLARRWLFPDDDHWLDVEPWRPDFQLRLVRNDPALLRFPGVMHSSAAPIGPGRFLEAPLYHLLLRDTTEEERAEKAWRYERERPGIRVEGGIAQNAYYLPERLPSLRVAKVPAVDRALIAAVRSAAPAPPTQAPADIDFVPLAEVDRYWERRHLEEAAYRAKLRVVDPPPRLNIGRTAVVTVAVENLGIERWPWQADAHPVIRLSYRWRNEKDRTVVEDGIRTSMPADLHPGTKALVPMTVKVPDDEGRYRLGIDLVHELVRWFDCETIVDVDVKEPDQVALIGRLSHFRQVGEDTVARAHLLQLADVVPWIEPVLVSAWPEVMTQRFGCRSIEGLHRYLLSGLRQRERTISTGVRLERRLARLLADARRIGRGEEARLVPDGTRNFLMALARMQLLVLMGADSLTSHSRLDLWSQAATALAAEAMDIPVMISGVTAGPFTRRGDKKVAGRMFRAAQGIIVRDRHRSRDVLEDLGIEPYAVREEPDHAMALRPAPAEEVDCVLAQHTVEGDQQFAVTSLHHCAGLESVLVPAAAIARHLRERGILTIFIPHCVEKPDDDRHAHALLVDLVGTAAEVALLDPVPPDDVVAAIVARSEVAFGTRYHLAVLAAAAGVPALGFFGDPDTERKLAGLAEFAPDTVRSLAATIGPEAALSRLTDLMARGGIPQRPSGHLPAVAWLRARASMRTGPRQAETGPA